MTYRTIWVSIYSFKCFKTIGSGLFTSTLFSPCSYCLDRNRILVKFLRILTKVMYFKDRKWISKTLNCISYSVICKIVFCSEFPDIPHEAERRRRRRRRSQAIEKRYAFHANVKSLWLIYVKKWINFFQKWVKVPRYARSETSLFTVRVGETSCYLLIKESQLHNQLSSVHSVISTDLWKMWFIK